MIWDMDALREELEGLRERQRMADSAEAEGRVVDRAKWLASMRDRRQRIEELAARVGDKDTITYSQARPFPSPTGEPVYKDCLSHDLLDETDPTKGDPCPPSSPTV